MQPASCLASRIGLRSALAAAYAVAAGFLPVYAFSQQPVASSQPFNGMVLELKRSEAQQADLDRFLAAVQTPGTPEYHHWLTPEQFAQRFAPDTAAEANAGIWLQQQGFTVVANARNGMRITFNGTAAQVERSFATSLQLRPRTSSGEGVTVPSVAVSLPASKAFAVTSVHGFAVSQADQGTVTTLAAVVEANTAGAVLISPNVLQQDAATVQELLAEAAAQGITVVQTGAGSVEDGANASTAVLVGADDQVPTSADARPLWQSAAGLPVNGLRATPDATFSDLPTLVQALNHFAQQHGRVGQLAPALYRLSSGHQIFSHPDSNVPEGTWTAADGLGTINLNALLKALATGSTGVNVKLAASNTTVTHGQQLSLTYTVTGTGGTPSGTVTATLAGRTAGNTVTLGPASLNASGVATFESTTLAGDVYDLSGTYSGDSTFAAGTSNTVTTTVSPENVALTATAPSTMVGATIPVTVTATAASGVGVPTGAVTVTAYGTGASASSPPTYTATLPSSSTSSATAVVSVPASTVGKYTFQATCTSSASFACNQPTSFAVAVTQTTPTVTLTSTAEATVPNSATQKYDLAVTVAAPSGSTTTTAPTGTVTVQDNGTAVGTITLANGAGTYVLSLSGTGHSLVAVYGGDTNYATASSAAVPVNAPVISTTTALTASPVSTSYGSAISFTSTVTPASYAASGAPTGTVTLKSSLQGTFATGTLSGGFVTVSSAALQAGTHTVTAVYAGDTNYATSTSSQVTITVKPGKVATTTALTVSPTQPLAGQNTTLTATVTPGSTTNTGTNTTPLVCTGQVTFFSNSIYVAAGTLSNGTVSVTGQLKSGSDSLTAVYNGDTNCYGSTSAALVVSPLRVASAVTLQPSVTYSNAGQTIQLTATVSPGDAATLGTPTGTVTFYDSRAGVLTPVGSGALTATGTGGAIAAISVNGSSAGAHSFSAAYSGDTIFLPSTSDPVTVNFGDLALALNPASMGVPRGGVATAVATLTTSNGFSSTVVLSCAPPASSFITCSFQPSTLSGAGSSTLSVTTTASTTKAMHVRPQMTSLRQVYAAGGLLLSLGLLWPLRQKRLTALLLLVCCAALTAGGCGLGMVDTTNNQDGGGSGSSGNGSGSGSSATGTPLGTQLLTVTASSSDGTLRHTYTFPVNVQ